MKLFEDAQQYIQNLFGLNIEKIPVAEDESAAIGTPYNDDGSTVVAPSIGGAYYGVYMDIDGAVKSDIAAITQYRQLALYPEVDIAIQDIVNEAIPHENDSPQIDVILDDLDISDNLKMKIEDEFKIVLSKLKYTSMSSDIFRRWYVDGRLFFQIIVDKVNPSRGILELRPLEATKIRKVKEVIREKTPMGVDAVKDVVEYYVYNEAGFGALSSTVSTNTSTSASVQGIKISPDSIIYVPSGYFDTQNQNGNCLSYIHKAIRPINQLRMLEDATVVYTIARAPERRIFYVDVGNLPKLKAEQYVKDLMNRYRNKMVYDAKTGEVRDDKKYMSMLEDFWMPRRDGGKGTEITTLPGAQNLQGQIDVLQQFQEKMYMSLNVPISRIKPETGFSLGRGNEITRDELKFQKFIEKLRRKFSVLFYESLKIQLILKGIINNEEWEEIIEKLRFRYQRDNYFSELKNQDIWNSRFMTLQSANQYAGIYFSKRWIQQNVLQMTEEDIAQMEVEIDEEQDDETATIWGQMQLSQPPMPPGMMGGDPSMGGQDPSMMGQDPFAAQEQGQVPPEEDDESQQPNQKF